jgi:hypothetical protein
MEPFYQILDLLCDVFVGPVTFPLQYFVGISLHFIELSSNPGQYRINASYGCNPLECL